MIVEIGRPEDCSGRLEKEIRCYDLLDRLHVMYHRCDHQGAGAETMEECLAIENVLKAPICKNLFLCNRQKTAFYLLLMPGDKVFKTKELSAQINSARLSFAGPEDMEKYLDITPGSVSVLGLMNDHENAVKLLIDRDLLEKEFIGCHPCINTSTLGFRTTDLLEKVIPEMHHEPFMVKLMGVE